MSVCVCSNVCVPFVNDCVAVYAFSGLFVCVFECVFFARRVRVVCLRVSVWCCMVCFCVLFVMFICGVECVCGLLPVPSVRLPVLFARFCFVICCWRV